MKVVWFPSALQAVVRLGHLHQSDEAALSEAYRIGQCLTLQGEQAYVLYRLEDDHATFLCMPRRSWNQLIECMTLPFDESFLLAIDVSGEHGDAIVVKSTTETLSAGISGLRITKYALASFVNLTASTADSSSGQRTFKRARL